MDYECKYVADASRVPALAGWLGTRFPADAEYSMAEVHSIYFDTPGLDALAESRDGEVQKCKHRLRFYDGDLRHAFLECKERSGRQRTKQRRPIDAGSLFASARVPSLVSGVWSSLARDLERMSPRPPRGPLGPVLHLRFRRSRFVTSTGQRLSLDHGIQVVALHPRLGTPGPGIGPLPWAVFETKGACMEFEGAAAVRALGFRRGSFSKYSRVMDRLCGASA